jgi:hypothetical protein
MIRASSRPQFVAPRRFLQLNTAKAGRDANERPAQVNAAVGTSAIRRGVAAGRAIARTLLCVYALGLMGVISPYATGPAPMYFGSGYIGKADFWKFGLMFGIIYFAALLLIVMPWLQAIR